MDYEVYARPPLRMDGTIPVFSVFNEYTGNYKQISADHVNAMRQQQVSNPWIPEKLWVQMETPTIAPIQKYSKPDDMILDVGVGLGRLLSHFLPLRRWGWKFREALCG